MTQKQVFGLILLIISAIALLFYVLPFEAVQIAWGMYFIFITMLVLYGIWLLAGRFATK